eukprot:SAG22_NODE_331_length_12174_cov_12.920497_3_plen_80_part_00
MFAESGGGTITEADCLRWRSKPIWTIRKDRSIALSTLLRNLNLVERKDESFMLHSKLLRNNTNRRVSRDLWASPTIIIF